MPQIIQNKIGEISISNEAIIGLITTTIAQNSDFKITDIVLDIKGDNNFKFIISLLTKNFSDIVSAIKNLKTKINMSLSTNLKITDSVILIKVKK
ncbi:MAG: hypothetical protein LBL60_02670 [Mycoplasmataceae bacterium]|jgi:hypothetical protein|nr:hypothetical protein [Mycoplasmataceae bacterium]